MGSLSQNKVAYADVFAAVGRFLAKRGLTDVCVMEFEDGLIVTGSALYETGEGYNRRTETHVFSLDDLKRMVKGG
jgi:hypothetical protein